MLTESDSAEVLFTLGITPPLNEAAFAKSNLLLPTLITALAPTIHWVLHTATEEAKTPSGQPAGPTDTENGPGQREE